MNKDMDEVKVMSQMLEKFDMLELMSKLPSPTEGMLSARGADILIAGSDGPKADKTAEIYSWEKNRWFEVSPMNEGQCGASSFIYNDQVFVFGGYHSKTPWIPMNYL